MDAAGALCSATKPSPYINNQEDYALLPAVHEMVNELANECVATFLDVAAAHHAEFGLAKDKPAPVSILLGVVEDPVVNPVLSKPTLGTSFWWRLGSNLPSL